MTTIRKRRWLLATVAIVLVAGAVGVVAFREDPKDVPRLVMLRQEQKDGQKVVWFRFDAPKHRGALIERISTQNPATGEKSSPLGVFDLKHRYGFAIWGDGVVEHLKETEAGQSWVFNVVTPVEAWRLRCDVLVPERELVSRLKLCWYTESLRPLVRKAFGASYVRWGTLESELITNAVPPNPDPP